jgi:hypothetical protein
MVDVLTLEQARNLRAGIIIYSVSERNADETAKRFKVTSVKTWKREPNRIRVSLNAGLISIMSLKPTT